MTEADFTLTRPASFPQGEVWVCARRLNSESGLTRLLALPLTSCVTSACLWVPSIKRECQCGEESVP